MSGGLGPAHVYWTTCLISHALQEVTLHILLKFPHHPGCVFYWVFHRAVQTARWARTSVCLKHVTESPEKCGKLSDLGDRMEIEERERSPPQARVIHCLLLGKKQMNLNTWKGSMLTINLMWVTKRYNYYWPTEEKFQAFETVYLAYQACCRAHVANWRAWRFKWACSVAGTGGLDEDAQYTFFLSALCMLGWLNYGLQQNGHHQH